MSEYAFFQMQNMHLMRRKYIYNHRLIIIVLNSSRRITKFEISFRHGPRTRGPKGIKWMLEDLLLYRFVGVRVSFSGAVRRFKALIFLTEIIIWNIYDLSATFISQASAPPAPYDVVRPAIT
jgi:hypothetical protein